jgi:hypothetical protein
MVFLLGRQGKNYCLFKGTLSDGLRFGWITLYALGDEKIHEI